VELRERIFEPYVTANKRGTGLGLAVCQRIASEHHAQLTLAPPSALPEQPPPATVFRILFPAAADAPETARKRLLVVDDEAIIRMVFRDLMGKECEVLEAADVARRSSTCGTARWTSSSPTRTCRTAPAWSWPARPRLLHPTSRVIVMTGYPSLVTTQEALELGVLDYLLKPFDEIREVRALIRRALSAPLPEQPAASDSRRVTSSSPTPPPRGCSPRRSLSGATTRASLHVRGGPAGGPAAVVVSWDFRPGACRKALELGKALAQGAPFVVLAST